MFLFLGCLIKAELDELVLAKSVTRKLSQFSKQSALKLLVFVVSLHVCSAVFFDYK